MRDQDGVASFTDAWIETVVNATAFGVAKSHLLQMRGLKHPIIFRVGTVKLSHLLQMRGLKRAKKHP